MFSVHCPTHGSAVLLPMSRVERIDSGDGRHDLRWRCWCGTVGSTRCRRRRSA